MGLTYKRGIYPRETTRVTTCETLVRHQTLSEPDGCRDPDRSFISKLIRLTEIATV